MTVSDQSATPSPDDAEDSSRERILQAAEEEFAEKGFAGVRIDEIARAAGANKQLIYYYFGSKAKLYDAVLERMIDARTPFWDAFAQADFETALDMLTARPTSVSWERLLSWEGSQFRNEGSLIRQPEMRRARYVSQAQFFRKAQAKGEFDPDLDPEMMAILVAVLNLSRATLPQVVQLATGLDADSEEYAERERIFLRALIHRLSPGSARGQ